MACSLLAGLAVATWVPGAAARSPQPPPDLGQSVAQRLRRWLGVPVRIGSLRYQLLESTFRGRDLRIGPSSDPYLRLEQLAVRLKVSLFGAGRGQTIRALEARDFAINVPVGWLGSPLVDKPPSAAFAVQRLRLSQGQIALRGQGRQQLRLERVELRAADLAGAAADAGQLPPLSGALTLTVGRIQLGDLVLSDLELHGELRPKRRELVITRLAVRGLGGELLLSGKVALGRRRPVDRIALAGTAKINPGQINPALGPGSFSGTIAVKGRWGRGLAIAGKLAPAHSGQPALQPTRGAAGAALALPFDVRLAVRLGKRRLVGTLSRWRLR